MASSRAAGPACTAAPSGSSASRCRLRVLSPLAGCTQVSCPPGLHFAWTCVLTCSSPFTCPAYHYAYTRFLSHARFKPLHILEIGLGCNMGYGPGASLKLWRAYLPCAKISYLEYNKCVGGASGWRREAGVGARRGCRRFLLDLTLAAGCVHTACVAAQSGCFPGCPACPSPARCLAPAALPACCRECADKWKDYVEKEAGGKLYIGACAALVWAAGRPAAARGCWPRVSQAGSEGPAPAASHSAHVQAPRTTSRC